MLLRDLIDIPERVHRGDFVLKLTEGVQRAAETLENYIVTPQLAEAFDKALGLIRSATEGGTSKACYLHGSFGAGKSHFMAVLLLLLEQNADARSKEGLEAVVAANNAWTQGRRFLLVPFNVLGASSLEEAILGGYVDHMARQHPEAPVPGVYRADALFADANRLRGIMGDAAFFDALRGGRSASAGGGGGGGGWGDLGTEGGWDAASFERATAAPARDEERGHLFDDLVKTFYQGARQTAEFVSLDEGLAAMSRHAKALGYDALILFLDEVILWLASNAADLRFIAREGQKLVKLVEAQTADRPVPIVSFVARQRDLRTFVGEHFPGADQLGFSDVLKFWEARFATVTLEDRNLPLIVEKRILRAKDDAARATIDRAFAETTAVRQEVLDVLITERGDREMFRKVYPFSPALVETLVAVSSLLQRERTALKVMVQLLVAGRDRLQLGEIVPVGDLFDAVADGDEAFAEAMRRQFDLARKLYEGKLRPMLEAEHGVRFDDPSADPAAVNLLRNDDRLVKTLLLSALAPEVESLRALTPRRLAALNHGTIRSPIKNREPEAVLAKCRRWAAQVGQLKVRDDSANPLIELQLSAVDVDGILAQVQGEDNIGNRIRKVKDLVLVELLGLPAEDELWLEHVFTWRATRRHCRVLFANVRTLREEQLRGSGADGAGDDWRVVIDYPFDEEGHHGPMDDVAKVRDAAAAGDGTGSNTLVWLPSFLSDGALTDLGKLVLIDHLLTGERLANYVGHLGPGDRVTAKALLDNQRSQLRQKVILHLETVYGIRERDEFGSLAPGNTLERAYQFLTLRAGSRLQPPAAANLKTALANLLDQGLRQQFPAHPVFEDGTDLRPATLRRVLEVVERAAGAPGGRVEVERDLRRPMRQIVGPLLLGEMHEVPFLLGDHWKNHFLRREAQNGAPLRVRDARAAIDEPQPWGLPAELADLIVLAFAAGANRTLVRAGLPVRTPTLGDLPDDAELREQSLPDEGTWTDALHRAEAIFGVSVPTTRNAGAVARLSGELRARAVAARGPAADLVAELRARGPALGLPTTGSGRLRTAEAASRLVETLSEREGVPLFKALASAEIVSSEAAMQASLSRAQENVDALRAVSWPLFGSAPDLPAPYGERGQAVLDAVAEAAAREEYAVPLALRLRAAQTEVEALFAESSRRTATSPAGRTTPPHRSPEPTTGTGGSGGTLAGGASEREPAGEELCRQRGRSQVRGDDLPAALPAGEFWRGLRVHRFANGNGTGTLVVSAGLLALIQADPACRVDPTAAQMTLFGTSLDLDLAPSAGVTA